MRREKFFCLSLSGFAEASMGVLIALVLAGTAGADTIRDFIDSGTAENLSGVVLGTSAAEAFCSVSGAMMINVTAAS